MPSSEKERLREALFHTREIEFYNEIKKRHEQGEISQEDVAILENVLFVEHQLEVVVASSDDFTPDLKKKLDSIKDKVFKNMQDMFGEEVIQSIQTNNPEEIAYSDSRVEEIIAKERNTRKHVLKEFVINEIKFIVNLQLYLENFSDEMAPELHEDIAEYIRSSKAMLQASGVDNVEEIFNQFKYLENNKKDYAESKDLKARENEIFAQIPDTKLKAESMANFYSECESRLLRIAHAAHDANIALISIDFATSSPQNTETSARNLFEGMRQLIGGGSSKELGDTAQEIEQNEDSKKDKQANLLGAIYNRVARIHMPAENYSQIRAGRPAFWIRKIKRDGLSGSLPLYGFLVLNPIYFLQQSAYEYCTSVLKILPDLVEWLFFYRSAINCGKLK